MNNFSRRMATAFIAAAAFAVSAPQAFAQKCTELKVAAYPANPPWENKKTDGTFEGFEVDLANEIGKRMGCKVSIQDMDFKALFTASAAGRVDMVISSLTITDERLKSQAFTQPYFEGALAVGTKDGSSIKSVEDLKGKTVGAVATSFPENWLKERAAQLGYKEYKSYDTTANMLMDLRNGRVDAVVNDVVGLRHAFKQMSDLKVAAEIVTGEKFAMMTPKNSQLLPTINQHLSDMKKDGTMARLYQKWMGVAAAAGSLTLTPLPVPTSAK